VCGIAGVFNVATGQAVDPMLLQQMLVQLCHRGPDQAAIFREGRLGFAHRRLKIVDLQAGQQPMADPSGQVVLCYNGEVWNYLELRGRLEQRGYCFTSKSDTEVVLNAYLEYGETFVEQLDGMFALAIWDARQQHLVLARDRMGKKPLYYAQTERGDLIFGSEIKALLCDPRLSARMDPQALADFLVLRYVPAPATMFAGILKLPPATVMVVSASGLRQRAFWDLPLHGSQTIPARKDDLLGLIRDTIRNAVKIRLMGDVPLGALLSGGVDSSVLVAVASQLLDQPLKTFSVRFGDAPPEFDETPYARFVAGRFRTEHHEITVGQRELYDTLPLAAWHRDEPISEPAEIPTLLICQAAKPHATILLSGEGGDELFAGYPKYAYDWLAAYTAALPSPARAALRSGVEHIPQRYRRVKVAARSILETDEARRFITWFGGFDDADKQRLLSPYVLDQVRALDTSRIFRQRLTGLSTRDRLARMLYLDSTVWLPDNLLMKGDKMSMAASTELRMPFLDRQLLDLAVSIPTNRRVRPFVSKYLLKEAYTGILPREFLYRRKVGFQVPVGLWFRSPRMEALRGLLVDERARARNLFQPAAVQQLLDEHMSGKKNHQSRLFVLLAIELWHRVHVDDSYTATPAWQDITAA
jgi:asparagine synthase (glutamine-hydrolysing)